MRGLGPIPLATSISISHNMLEHSGDLGLALIRFYAEEKATLIGPH